MLIAENLSKATDKMIEKNLMFNADKVGSPIIATMSKKGAKAWFGTTPPDLSLVAHIELSLKIKNSVITRTLS
jgi:hypothetical protein